MKSTKRLIHEELNRLFQKIQDNDGNQYVNPVEHNGKWWIYRSGGFGWTEHNDKKDAIKAMMAWGDWLAAMDAN